MSPASISNTAPPGVVPDSVKWSFYLGGTAFLLAVLWTVFRTKEYSPEELEAFEADLAIRHVLHRTEHEDRPLLRRHALQRLV